MTATITDETAVAASLGDREAFARLWQQHRPRVVRLVRSRVSDWDAADDIVNDTFHNALRSIEKWRNDGPGIENWLITIATNQIRQHIRYLRRHPTLPVLYDRPAPDNVEHKALTRVAALDVLRVIGGLGSAHRVVMLLRFIDGLTVPETAKEMGRTESTVANLQNLAKVRIQMKLDPVRYRPRQMERTDLKKARRLLREAALREARNADNVSA